MKNCYHCIQVKEDNKLICFTVLYSSPLTCLRSIFHYTVSPFDQFADEIVCRVRLKLLLNFLGTIPNVNEENAA